MWSTCKITKKNKPFKSEIIWSYSSASVTIKYPFCLIVEGNKMHQGGKLSRIPKGSGGLDHFLVIMKWTWEFFPKICKLTSPYN